MAIPWLVVVGVGVAIRDSMGCSSFWFCLFEGFCCKEGNRKWCIEVFCPCVFYMSLEVWGNEAAISLPLPEGAWIGGVFSLLGNHTENSILWVWQLHLQGRLRCWSTAGRGLFCLWMVHVQEGGLFAWDSLLSAFFVNNDIATSISPSQYAVRHPSAYRASRFPVLAKQTGVSRNCTKDVRCAADIPCLLLICRVINGRILRWRSVDGASVILRKSLHELCSFDIMLPSVDVLEDDFPNYVREFDEHGVGFVCMEWRTGTVEHSRVNLCAWTRFWGLGEMMLDDDAVCGNLDSSAKFLQDDEIRKRGDCNYQWSLIVEIFTLKSTCMCGVLSVMVTAICRLFKGAIRG